MVDDGDTDYLDPLRRSDNNAAVCREDLEGVEDSSASGLSAQVSFQNSSKEWVSFKRSLMQRFPVSKTVLTSSVSSSCFLIGLYLDLWNVVLVASFYEQFHSTFCIVNAIILFRIMPANKLLIGNCNFLTFFLVLIITDV